MAARPADPPPDASPATPDGAAAPGRLRDVAAALLGAAAVTLFFSEFFFLNEGPVARVLAPGGDPFDGFLEATAFLPYYAGFALVLLAALSAFRVRHLAGLVLAGCLFGWSVEATVIALAYENVPVSLLWPSVGWHMPVVVLFGVFGLPALLRGRWPVALLAGVGLGLAWGLWATWLWVDPGARLTPDAFWSLTLATAPLLVGGMALVLRFGPAMWHLPRWACGVTALVALVLGIAMGLPHPVGLVLLAALVALSVWALARLARPAPDPRTTALHPAPAPAWRAAFLLPAAPVAGVTYAAAWANDTALPSEDVILLLLFSATCAFLLAIRSAFTSG